MAWYDHQRLLAVYQARPVVGRRLVAQISGGFPTYPIPEITRLDRTLRRLQDAILPYFDTACAWRADGGGQRRYRDYVAGRVRVYRYFDNYHLRFLLIAGGQRPWKVPPAHGHP